MLPAKLFQIRMFILYNKKSEVISFNNAGFLKHQGFYHWFTIIWNYLIIGFFQPTLDIFPKKNGIQNILWGWSQVMCPLKSAIEILIV